MTDPALIDSRRNRLLVRLEGADAQLDGVPVLHDITWEIRSQSHWLLRGPNGSGKSTLLRLLAGALWPAPGQHLRRIYHIDGAPSWSPAAAAQHIASLRPEDQDLYFVREWNPPARDVVAAGLFDCALLHQTLNPAQDQQVASLFSRLGLESLASIPFLELSQGQQRQILIARALVRRPALLLLDEFSDGLDPLNRRAVYEILARAARAGATLVVATHRDEAIPGVAWNHAWIYDGRLSLEAPANQPAGRSAPSATAARPASSRSAILRLQNVTFYRGDNIILEHVDWEVSPHSHCAVAGRNGSGKTSLFLLLAGELHPLSGGSVERFGHSSLTLADIRSLTGFFYPELHAWLDPDAFGWAVVAGPLSGALAVRDPLTQAEARRVRQAAAALEAEELLPHPVSSLSYGQVRRLLLARSLVHEPPLLLLDEPFDGLDTEGRLFLTHALDEARNRGGTVLLTAHVDEDMPHWIQRRCRLENRTLTDVPPG